jgi:hypothetical protein
MAGTGTTEAGRRGAPLVRVTALIGLVLGLGVVTACSDDEAKACAEQSGATFCVERQGTGVEPTAEGLLPGSTLSFSVSGTPASEPFTSEVGPDGVPDKAGVVGSLGPAGAEDLAGESVVFTGTAADGTPITVTLEVPG